MHITTLIVSLNEAKIDMVSDRLISPWKLIHFGLIITSCDRSFRTSSVIWLPAGLGVAVALHTQAILIGRFCSPETKKCGKLLAHAGASGMHDTKLNMGTRILKLNRGLGPKIYQTRRRDLLIKRFYMCNHCKICI